MRVAVYCGSSDGTDPAYREAAARLGALLAGRGHVLVYGGASVGLMGTVADAALEAGGEVHGVIPAAMSSRELAHGGLTHLDVVADMHARKARMTELSDAVIALPGGLGTMEELFEVWTWRGLGLHHQPLGLLDVGGYYTPLVAMLDAMVTAGFVRPQTRGWLTVHDDEQHLLTELETQA